ncbi:MAG: glycogen/starch synthase [Bacteroidales bacterium]|nr:glycogen/starch synthase [Bacteroidales bacterium]
MDANVKRVLFVNSEIFPYLPENRISTIGRYLPQGIQEHKKEIRSFMPRYGCINERKNQLHEVIRLSGMNIIISDVDRPLIIKVASNSSARLQIYFNDNEDYFKRKGLKGTEKELYADNDERAIFFARGVMETVKKLRWAPDIIHCQGWISHLVPLYLKKAYKDDPIFASSKVVLSLYDEGPVQKFSPDFASKVLFGAVAPEDLSPLDDSNGLAMNAIRYCDGVIIADGSVPAELTDACRKSGLPLLDYDPALYEDKSYIEAYDKFYDSVQK